MSLPAHYASLPPAIVLGGEHIGLSVARSLAARDIAVYALGHRDDPLRHSRRRTSFVEVGGGAELAERSLEWLRTGPGAGVLMPCADEALELIARHRDELADLGYIPIEANDEVLLAMLDKERTNELARSVGVECPRTVAVDTVEEALAAASEIGYPCALKPRRSHEFAHVFGAANKAFAAAGDADLEQAMRRTLELGLSMQLTEIIPGPDDSYCSLFTYLDEGRAPLLQVTKRKLRQFPNTFGMGSYHVTAWVPDAAEEGLRFLQGIGARGLANVEFKRDSRDGRLKLIECNHRFVATNEHLRACGCDLAWFTYCRLTGTPVQPPRFYHRGVGYWYPLRDFRAFRGYRRSGALTWRAWLKSLRRPLVFPLASRDDPMPSIVAAWRHARRLGRRLSPWPAARRAPASAVAGRRAPAEPASSASAAGVMGAATQSPGHNGGGASVARGDQRSDSFPV